ncbi:glycosyltransferase family 4 protein [Acinetobacter sp. VNH17]|uniref:Glycosyltransferase family 4 protein n=1 Tax=Acinetobacter thutiue TaxID=2998078 RepID=A0ABT7WPA5_9GAMM|nr:glycosyltransferase family 4 protein [Acinetobacter thutiue]MCY6412406.1 glycosyltransferase family 4 protein [Acinetobacter thutiue]MDN0014510.1 glycosyltransferase family 4 protein [Acinetobacter thutiue]
MEDKSKPAIWFPTVKTNTGTDNFTEQLVIALNQRGFQAEITWLPHHAEYLPWLVPTPQKPDWANIVHINSWLAPKFIPKNLPVVTTVHLCVQDNIIQPYKSLAQHLYHKFWITLIEQHALEHANVVTCVSLYTKNKVQNIFNIKNIELIYNGIDIEKFKYKDSTHTNKPFKLLFAGSSSIRKGFDLLPLIMEQLGDEYELIFTSNTLQSPINLPQNMKPIPYCKTQEEMLSLYHSVDALIFPSRLEGFGLVVVEAMACGLPVVIANSSALTELVEHSVTGFLCEKDNIQDFVQTIRYLNQHPELCIQVGKQARETAITKFNIDNIVNQYINLYSKALLP